MTNSVNQSGSAIQSLSIKPIISPFETCTPAFLAADLQASPECVVWGFPENVSVHVSDDEIIPGGLYSVEAIDCECDFGVEGDYSEPLSISTSMWGDVVGDFVGSVWTAPNDVVDFIDISSLVDKFRNLPDAPKKARTDVAGDTPDRKIDFVDITCVVDGFRADPCSIVGPPVTDPCAR